MINNQNFRWDIQGLRAIAVLCVVVFHIVPESLPGGFIGVDMFFVISGYLIMGQIWKGINKGSFSLYEFYCRRVKRLFPALFVTLLVTSIFSYYLLIPSEFSNYFASLVASLAYVSNFWFYSKSGYFDSELELSPLLHTWSLSVEEQFYIVIPIVLIFCFRKKINIQLGLLFIFAASLLFSEALLHINESFSFYASPSRFWQFVAGGFISICIKSHLENKIIREILTLLSILVLVYCMFYMPASNFPGMQAIAPTLATAILLYCCKSNDISYQILANPVFRFFGNTSYSLYLWHWPAIIFYKLLITPELSGEHILIVFFISTLLGYLSYTYIELPTKNINFKAINPIIVSLISSVAICCIVFASINLNHQRYSDQQLAFETYLSYPAIEFRRGSCFLTSKYNSFSFYKQGECIKAEPNKTNILLIGDSHAAHWYGALDDKLTAQETLTQVTASGCKPVLNTFGAQRCKDLINWTYSELINQHKFDKVFISARWVKEDAKKLEPTIYFLKKHIKNIVLLGPIIEYDGNLPRILITEKNKLQINTHAHYQKVKASDIAIEQVAYSTGAEYVSVLESLCPEQENCKTTVNGVPIQFDYGHLTLQGAKYIVEKERL